MREARISLRFFVHSAIAAAPVTALMLACDGTSTTSSPPAGDAGTSEPAVETTSDQPDGGNEATAEDAGEKKKTTCQTTRAYYESCGNEADLNCGTAGFDAWCAANDKMVNSEAFRRAEARCLTTGNCDGADRRDCEYGHYADETPTPAQKALVTAYCQTCEPSNVAGCTKSATTYDRKHGIESVPDIFIAAWELSDELVNDIETSCTGATVDAGADPAACAEAFADCAGGLYLDRIPDCAK